MKIKSYLKGEFNFLDFFRSLKYKRDFRKTNPHYFDPEGLLVFCGPQGSGKTLSAVRYVKQVLQDYPYCIFISNVSLSGLPADVTVLDYSEHPVGSVTNGFDGVLYLIDEIHLEWNSLESKSISIEEMTEFAQQRKQRVHIVGTSQVFMRLAKPLREQIRNVVLCKNFFGLLQHNILIDGDNSYEENGRLHAKILGNFWFFHSPDLYKSYDTYSKMQRYRGQVDRQGFSLPYDSAGGVSSQHVKRLR